MVTLKDIPLHDGAAFFRALATLHRETADHLEAIGYPDLALVERGLAADFEERAERLTTAT